MGRLKHLQQGLRSFGHIPNTKISRSNDVYGFGGAEYWWDASVGLNTSTNLGAVSYWDDRISNFRFSQGAAANQPRLRLVSTINASFPSIENVTGSWSFLTSSVVIPCFRKTIAFVAKVNSINANANTFFRASTGGVGIFLAGNNANITGIGLYQTIGFAQVVATTVEDTNSHIVVITPNAIIIDGVVQANGGSSNLATAFNTLLGNPFDGTQSLSGEIGELLIYNRNLTNQQAIELCNNINQKWVIY